MNIEPSTEMFIINQNTKLIGLVPFDGAEMLDML